MATSIRRTVTNFKVVQLVPIFRLPLNKTRFTLQLSGGHHGVGGVRGFRLLGWPCSLPWRAALAGDCKTHFLEGQQEAPDLEQWEFQDLPWVCTLYSRRGGLKTSWGAQSSFTEGTPRLLVFSRMTRV